MAWIGEFDSSPLLFAPLLAGAYINVQVTNFNKLIGDVNGIRINRRDVYSA
jgi:hypothetical protein